MSEPETAVTDVPTPPERFALVHLTDGARIEKFPNAIAHTAPNGSLMVVPQGSQVPIKGYAPGTWTSFEHRGDYTTPRPPVPRQPVPVMRNGEHVAWRVPRQPIPSTQRPTGRTYEQQLSEIVDSAPVRSDQQLTELRPSIAVRPRVPVAVDLDPEPVVGRFRRWLNGY